MSIRDARVEVPGEWAQWMRRLPVATDWRIGAEDHRLIDGPTWIDRLPRLAGELLDAWGLEVEGPGWTGWTSLVLPVRRGDEALALKVCWPHPEAAAEHLALRRWDGHGAVRLVAADPRRGGLLLERLEAGRDLDSMPIDEACTVIGGLLRRLHVEALPGAPRLSEFLAYEVDKIAANTWLPRRFKSQALSLARDLTAQPDADATLLHTDLHYRNVLAGTREPWLVIDPKPMGGHPGFELQPVLRNRVGELRAAPNLRRAVRRRLDVTCEAAGIDVGEAVAWTIVHATLDHVWDESESPHESINVAILKALNP